MVKPIVDIGFLSPYSPLGNTSESPSAFVPPKGVLVENHSATGAIATCSAVTYLDLLVQSIEALEHGDMAGLAANVGTSPRYAEIAAGRILSTLRWQKELLSSAREVFVGVVTANEKDFYAVGRRSVRRNKSSVAARIRQSLQIGAWNMYKVSNSAKVYAVPYTASKKTKRVIGMQEIVKVEDVHRPHFLFVLDSYHLRRYAGRTLFTNRNLWEASFKKGTPEDLTVFLCSADHGIIEHAAKDLMAAKHKDIFTGDHGAAMPANLSSLIETIKFLASLFTAGMFVTIYVTDHIGQTYDFGNQLKEVISTYPVMVRFTRFGREGYNTLRRIEWGLGYWDGVEYDMSNNRVRDLLPSIRGIWPSTPVGVRVNPSRVRVFMARVDVKVGDIAAFLNVDQRNILVHSSWNVAERPPYLYTNNGIAALMSGGESIPGVIASVPDEDRVYERGTYFYFFDRDLDLLLANT